jgi:NADH-quinone oxidoreductase subunit L
LSLLAEQGLNSAASFAACLIPTLPFLAMAICGLLCCSRQSGTRSTAAPIVIAAIAGSFICSLIVMCGLADATGGKATVHYFEWIHAGDFVANFSFYFDSLTILMLMVVTGIGTLIAVYAAGYMSGDEGYPRFFAYIGLFIFAMTCLVMADNLLLLFLGWEGVGAASYLLIGYYYRKPSAVAAAKKAFIVNRIGDFGFAIGLFATFVAFGTIEYAEIFEKASALAAPGVDLANADTFKGLVMNGTMTAKADYAWLLAIPFLLMMGAFGKSAQMPLHVWLPDAMEGPTPVSALIHAATMVTAGVYMIARLMPVFLLNPSALTTVAVVGGITAVFAATIALCQYDIKRIWAYSTLSQLGYMFLGVGVLGTTGAVFHLFTHAFFKALLFLTAGSVMHALAGQLDLRKMSGLRQKMPVTCWLMFIGCLALAGVPPLAGFWSKDMILADALAHPTLGFLGVLALGAALLTAFYTFRLWFRVFWGPAEWEMGTEHHGYPVAADDHHDHGHHEPHEMSWLMNVPLVVLAVGAVAAGFLFKGWVEGSIGASSANISDSALMATFGLADADALAAHKDHQHHMHNIAMIASFIGPVLMIGLAYYFHVLHRDKAAAIGERCKAVVKILHNKYYIDELYDLVIRRPLRMVGEICFKVVDRVIDSGVVDSVGGGTPRGVGIFAAMFQRSGFLQGYALSMAAGLVLILVLVLARWWM